MKGPKKLLSATEERTLAAIADRIFPETDTPGAVEIGAVKYIELALAGDYAGLVPLYRTGLRAVNRHAKAKFAAGFFSLSGEQMDLVLKDCESGAVPGCRQAAEFFDTVHYHVLEGIFCEPHYGGNKNMIGWRLVDFPGQQFGYPDAYINKRVDLEPVAVEDPDGAEKESCKSR
jgi:gluconate 2-dehydrogenase gamma chain